MLFVACAFQCDESTGSFLKGTGGGVLLERAGFARIILFSPIRLYEIVQSASVQSDAIYNRH